MKKVIKKIIEMLQVNCEEYGACGIGECLINWLELGNCRFEDLEEEDFKYFETTLGLNKREIQLVYEINPYVEQLTYKLAEMWEREDELNESEEIICI